MIDIGDTRLRELVEELCQRVKARYPEAEFQVYRRNGDPKEIYIRAYTDDEDDLAVLDTIVEREIEILVEEDYDIHVIPLPLSSLADPTAAWRQPNYVLGEPLG
jgi:hypothetical protein